MKKLIIYLILLGSIFADEEMGNRYIAANINILSGGFTSINYGNKAKNIEYNFSTNYSSELMYNDNYSFDGYEIDAFNLKVAMRRIIKESQLGSFIKNNYIGFGTTFSATRRHYFGDDSKVYSMYTDYAGEAIGLSVTYGTKLIYNLNHDFALELHIPYVTLNLLCQASDDELPIKIWDATNKTYRTQLSILSKSLINMRFYF